MSAVTQQELEGIIAEARGLATLNGKLEQFENDCKARSTMSLDGQARFFRGLIATFEQQEFSKYIDAPKGSTNDGQRKPDRSNPWSAAGWNISKQGSVVKAMGETKAAGIARAAGCEIGSTRPNPSFN